MPPKPKFTREEIISAAVCLVEREGFAALTARSLGDELGSSPRPVFSVFQSMDEVISEVFASAKALYAEYVENGLKEVPPFKGVGKSYIRFAAEHPRLFRLLFMRERNVSFDSVLLVIEESYDKILSSITDSYGLSIEKAKKLYEHLWIYSHGIAALIATGVCNFTPEEISQMLTEIFIGVIKKIKSEEKND